MGQGLGDSQKELLKIVSDEWMTTPEVARAYEISASDRNMYRTMICSLDGLVKKGRLLKEREINNGRVLSSWRINPDYTAPVQPAPAPAKKADKPAAHVSKKPTKSAPSKRASRPSTVTRSKT